MRVLEMMMLKTHGTAALWSGRILIETDYRPGNGGPGLLSLRLEDQETYESVDGLIRLDPWIGDEYGVVEFRTGNCFLICGAQAVVALDASNLALMSSLGLEYQEGETIDAPWHVEIEGSRLLILATERRVWCVDQRGATRWVWGCLTSEQDRWVSAEPVPIDDCVRVPLRSAKGDVSVDLQVRDGLPAPA
jgi:hypothetical protein